MKNDNAGFEKFFWIIIIALAAFIYFYKDKSGKTYYQKIQDKITDKVDYVQDQVEGVQRLAEERDQEIMDNL